MIVQGEIVEFEADGFERDICLKTEKSKMWCSLLEEEYAPTADQVDKLKIGQHVHFVLELEWVCEVKCLIQRPLEIGIKQNLPRSTHATVTGVVKEVESSDSMVLEIGAGTTIRVELEQDHKIQKGTYVIVEGNLRAEFVKS